MAYGKIAERALERKKKIGKSDLAFGSTTSAASRITTAAKPPRGTELGNDAKNIKIRQHYEEGIPEAMSPRVKP